MNKLTTSQRHYNELKRQRDLEAEQLLGYWTKVFGINKRDLDSHPQIDDVLLLIRYKAEFYHDQKAKHKRFFDNTWNWVYNHRLPLKAKQLRTLGYYAEGSIKHRQNIERRQALQRQKIQTRRAYHKALQAHS